MKRRKVKVDAVPATISRDEFNRILGNLVSSGPVKRKDERTGQKKKQGQIIPPKPQPGSEQR